VKNQLVQNWKFNQTRFNSTWFKVLIIILLVLGIFFRFANLDRKVYWYDETFTSLRVSGYTEAEVVQQLSTLEVIGVEDLQKYQHFNSKKGLIDTVKSLASEDPQHPPFYYAIARFWGQVFGTSVTAMRSLPALISLLAFPCIYWLCLELFESPLVGWMAVALITVSPFHVLYAQEARQYSLWPVTILLSSAALLRAMRLKTKASWSIYAVTLVASLYTFLLSGAVAIGHGIYVAAIERFRLTKTFAAYLVASLFATLAFLPWLFVVISNLSKAQTVTSFINNKTSLVVLLRGRIGDLSRIFLDLNTSPQGTFIDLIPIMLAILILLAMVGYSLYFLFRKTSKKVWLFILILIGCTVVPLFLPDLILGGNRSGTPRYLTPSYLGIQLAVAYLFATKISSISINGWQQKLWQISLATLISCGVLSCALSSQAKVWWNKSHNIGNPEVTRIINQANRPLLVSDAESADLLSLSYLLNPKVRLLVKPKCYTCDLTSPSEAKPNLPNIPNGFSDVFFFNRNSYEWLGRFQKEPTYKVEPVFQYQETSLWKLKK
jgi:uncharacterized membrane protein